MRALALPALALAAACGGRAVADDTAGELPRPPRPEGCAAVAEGEDLQARLDAADDGDALCLAPGRYPGTVVVRRAVTV